MKKKERRALAKYVRHVANEMNLRDWTITLAKEPCSDDLMGHHHAVDGVRETTIAVNARFRSYTPEDQREVIIHELLHTHHEVCWRMIQSDLAEPMGKIAYYVFCDAYRRAMEFQIDGVAKSLAPHMPLIDWSAC